MATSKRLGRELLVDYAWRAWSCLGVAGWSRGSFAACVDIEALVLLTGCLGDVDARLRDESLDWCAANFGLVSRSRLAHIVRDGSPNAAWAAYAATLQRATKQRWPGASKPFDWSPSRKSHLPERAQGATLALRCRALLGATARSEIVRVLLLDESGRPFDVRDLTLEAQYTKRGVAEALDNLRLAGVAHSTAVGNSNRYRLRRRDELETLLGPLPRVRTSQRAFCRVLWATTTALEEFATASDRIRRVEGARLARELENDVRRIDPRAAVPSPESSAIELLAAWCVAQCDVVAQSK